MGGKRRTRRNSCRACSRPLRLWQTTHEVGRDCHDDSPSADAWLEAFVALSDSWVQLMLRRNAGGHPQVVQAQTLWDALEARSHRPDALYRHLGRLPFHQGTLDSQVSHPDLGPFFL